MHKLSILTLLTPVIFLLFSMASPATATSLDTTLRAALGNSLTLQSVRQDWLAAHEEIGTAVSTSEWRTNGTVTGNGLLIDRSISFGWWITNIAHCLFLKY